MCLESATFAWFPDYSSAVPIHREIWLRIEVFDGFTDIGCANIGKAKRIWQSFHIPIHSVPPKALDGDEKSFVIMNLSDSSQQKLHYSSTNMRLTSWHSHHQTATPIDGKFLSPSVPPIQSNPRMAKRQGSTWIEFGLPSSTNSAVNNFFFFFINLFTDSLLLLQTVGLPIYPSVSLR